ncbi:MAG TPA: L-aspartate oxidase, partial [Verrucomicrobiales bacterium]|nr:L-aspartate oxidase [Verrucomicrobiales bacterium]
MREYDFLVVGTGISGLSFALKAAEQGTVAVLTKRKSEDSNTAWAQGGISCVADPEDSFESHVTDTLDAGAGLCDSEVVKTIVESAPDAIDQMISCGINFDRQKNGNFELGKEGGHSQRRILFSKDTTGKEISTKLLNAAKECSNINILEDHFAIDLITTEKLGIEGQNSIVGLYALNEINGEILTFRSNTVVLCTGGCGRVYLYTTNPN